MNAWEIVAKWAEERAKQVRVDAVRAANAYTLNPMAEAMNAYAIALNQTAAILEREAAVFRRKADQCTTRAKVEP